MIDKLPNDIIKKIAEYSTIKIYKKKFNQHYNSKFTSIELNNLSVTCKTFYKKKNLPQHLIIKEYDYPITYNQSIFNTN